MNFTLLKVLLALLPVLMLFFGALVLFVRGKDFKSFLQLFGAASLVLVPITHLFEALHVFPQMHWGMERSAGHYLDLGSATVGLILFPIGYLLHAITQRN